MKKIVSFLISALLILSVSSCLKKEAETTPAPATETTQPAQPAVDTTQPAPAPAPETK